MRLIDNLLGTKGSAERTPFERAQYVVSMVFRILDWKDRMRRADPSAARLNKDNIVRLKLFFYRECLRFEPMGGCGYWIAALERIVYEAPTQRHRIHLVYDMMNEYTCGSEILGWIHPTIIYKPIANDRRADRLAQKSAVREYVQQHHLPDFYENIYTVVDDRIFLAREDEIFEEFELKERNMDRVENILMRSMWNVRLFVDFVDRIAAIYEIDLQAVRAAYNRQNGLWVLDNPNNTRTDEADCLSDYLLVEDKEAVLLKLRNLPANLTPKMYGAIITVMVNKKIIRPIADGERSAIYRALCQLYDDGRNIGERRAVIKYICKDTLSNLDIASAEYFLR